MSAEGRKTKTPELKQSGQPGSGAAENSSRSNSSSTLDRTWRGSRFHERLEELDLGGEGLGVAGAKQVKVVFQSRLCSVLAEDSLECWLHLWWGYGH